MTAIARKKGCWVARIKRPSLKYVRDVDGAAHYSRQPTTATEYGFDVGESKVREMICELTGMNSEDFDLIEC